MNAGPEPSQDDSLDEGSGPIILDIASVSGNNYRVSHDYYSDFSYPVLSYSSDTCLGPFDGMGLQREQKQSFFKRQTEFLSEESHSASM